MERYGRRISEGVMEVFRPFAVIDTRGCSETVVTFYLEYINSASDWNEIKTNREVWIKNREQKQ